MDYVMMHVLFFCIRRIALNPMVKDAAKLISSFGKDGKLRMFVYCTENHAFYLSIL